MFNYFKAIPVGVALASAFFCCQETSAQRISLKTNTIDWVAMSPNLAVEARLSRRISLQLGISANPFSFSVFDARLSNYRVEPELRYWFNRPMARHFMALSATAAGFASFSGEVYLRLPPVPPFWLVYHIVGIITIRIYQKLQYNLFIRLLRGDFDY